MARPTKQGIDYFPMDCVPDSSLELFIAENGAAGFGLLIMIWQKIYRDEGYFIKNDDDLVLRLRRDSLLDMETTVSMIGNAVKRGLFDKDMHDKFGILTSRGIQRRYFNAAKQKKQARIYSDFCLIDINEYANGVSINGNPESSGENATKVKVKVKVNVKEEVKEGESAKRGSITCAREDALPSLPDVVSFFSAAKLPIYQAEQYYAHLSRDGPIPDWKANAMVWAIDNIKKHKRTNHAGNTAQQIQ